MRALAWAMSVLLIAAVGEARAQGADPIGPAVIDVRAMLAGLPTAEGWTPPLPADAEVAARALGLEAGAHVYFGRWGPARFGAGATIGWARGTAVPLADTAPEVVTRVRTFAPQLSLNFGQRLGFSYLSAGYGRAKVTSEVSALGTTAADAVDSGWVGAINFGGGARWFVTEHVGVGLDLRWHKLGSVAAAGGSAAAPRVTLFDFGVGVTLR